MYRNQIQFVSFEVGTVAWVILSIGQGGLLHFEVQVVAKDIIDWVYGLQVLPLNGDGNSTFEDGNSKLPRLQPSSAAIKYIPLYVGCLSVP